MAITTSLSDDDNKIHMVVDGRFDFTLYLPFKQALQASDKPDLLVEIDLSRTTHIDSSGLGMLLLARERVGGNRDQVKLIGVNQEIRSLLEISNFHRLITIV
jgi:anti-anti-sigma factor